MAVTWFPPLIMLAIWVIAIRIEWKSKGKSEIVNRWYTNVWFVILAICVWAVGVDLIFLRLSE